MSTVSLTPDRTLVATAVVATCVLFVPAAADPVNVVKLLALVLSALALAVLAVARTARERVLRLPVGAVVWAALAVLVALVVATVTAPDGWTAFWGTSGRNSGLLAYGSAVALLLVTVRVFDRPATKTIVVALLLAGSFTATYGLLQQLGVDAVAWNNPFSPIIAALGNPNFAAAYMGIALPAAVYGVLHQWPAPLRAICGVLAVLLLGVATVSESVQGPLAGGAGLVVLLLAWVLDRSDRTRRVGLVAVGLLGALGVAALGAGLLGYGPANAFFAGISYRARTWYWEAAITMFESAPLFGVGLDSYGIAWYRNRPLENAQELGGDHFSDAAHSVPLQLLGTGGLLLGLTYLALVLVTGWALVRGLRRLRGEDRLLLGALGGAWTAYQVQSIVSIDQVPLLTVHFVLAGAVAAAAGAVRLREVRLPGAVPRAASAETGRRRVLPTEREPSPVDYALIGLVTVGALFLAYQALDPLRANQAAYAGDVALAQGDGDGALAAYQRAIALQPENSAWHSRLGALYNQAGNPELARAAFVDATEVNPYDIAAIRTVGRFADAAGDQSEAEQRFRRAVALDPDNSATILDLATFLLRTDGADEALPLLESAVARLPGVAALWASLGDARLVNGMSDEARQAYERALEIQPDEPTATAGLAKLSAA